MRKSFTAILAGATLWALTISEAQAASKYLNATLQYQEKSNWCWAACTQMIMKYRARHFDEQCEIVELARSRNTSQWGNTACCLNPDAGCNAGQPNDMTPTGAGTTRELLGYHNIATGSYSRSLTYAESKTQINASTPFIVRWGWTGGGGHAVLADAYVDASGTLQNRLEILNPWPGEGAKMLDYTAVVTPSGGTWTSTMTTGAVTASNDKATLYANASFGGTSLVTASTTYVGDTMNDKTSSAKVRGTPYIFYQDASYGTMGWPASPKDFASYTNWNGANDAISSVMQMPGSNLSVGLILFENENFTGAYTVISSDNYNLHDSGWGDRASSLIVVSRIWNLYSDANLGGTPYAVTSFGGPNRDGFYPNPASWGGPNDDLSSAYWVPESWNPIILYADGDLTGRAVALWSGSNSAWLSNLSTIGFNDAVSAIRTYGDTWRVYGDLNQTGAMHELSPNHWYRSAADWGGNNDEITSVSYTASGAWL
jgi:hypothetical protein